MEARREFPTHGACPSLPTASVEAPRASPTHFANGCGLRGSVFDSYVLSFVFIFDKEADKYAFAYSYPFTYSHQQRLLAHVEWRGLPFVQRLLVCRSVGSLPTLHATNPPRPLRSSTGVSIGSLTAPRHAGAAPPRGRAALQSRGGTRAGGAQGEGRRQVRCIPVSLSRSLSKEPIATPIEL